jgi:hypothetical protein
VATVLTYPAPALAASFQAEELQEADRHSNARGIRRQNRQRWHPLHGEANGRDGHVDNQIYLLGLGS